MRLRRLHPEGIDAFRSFLRQCRERPDTELPDGLLQDERLTEVVEPEIAIEPRVFVTKGDAARYLCRQLEPLGIDAVSRDAGLWSWLSLRYFDSICPAQAGKRKLKSDHSYLFEAADSRDGGKHLLFVGWRILTMAPEYNRLFLHSSVHVLDAFSNAVMSRLYLVRIRCMFELLDRLYWDEAKGRPRSGFTSSREARAGDLLHRLPARIRQLEKTYDLTDLTADQLLKLLGAEFAFARPSEVPVFPEEAMV